MGFAVDVSGSMEQSIRNKSKKDENRLESFNDSLRKLSQEAKQEIKACKREGIDTSITVFSYGFGLKDLGYCDLLSLLKMDQQIMSSSKVNIQQKFDDPYQELADISGRYGVRDMEKYTKWGKEILSPTDTTQLANRMYEYPKIAERLTSLLPASFSEIEERVVNETQKGAGLGGGTGAIIGAGLGAIIGGPIGAGIGAAIGGGGGGAAGGNFAKDNQIKEERKKLEKPEALARELARASDEEVRKIIIREVGSGLEKELREYGDTTMPLEKVADLLESKEGQL